MMEISAHIQGTHMVTSNCGRYIASLLNSKLRVCSTFAPEKCSTVNIRPTKDIIAVRWSDDSARIAIVSAQYIEIVDLDDSGHRVRIDNGSGSLGRFSPAEFIESSSILITWEFGKAKLWDLSSGKSIELSDIKTTCSGSPCQFRPAGGSASTRTLATLSRSGADDVLNLYLCSEQKQLACRRLPTVDVQALSWSADGKWLAILDTSTAEPNVYIYTPDGHQYRAYPTTGDSSPVSLGVKACVWSRNSQILALTRYDGKIVLLNTKTFTPLAIIEHTTTVDQRSLAQNQQAPIWQEVVSATNDRTYATAAQPVSPPLSKTKPSMEPNELGVAEAVFSCDGSYLATRDERMLSTVWIWNMATLAAYSVLIQHSNVRRLQWHQTQPDLLLIDASEGIAYIYDSSSKGSPKPLSTSMPGSASLSWVHSETNAKTAILSTAKSSFRIVYPGGLPEGLELGNNDSAAGAIQEEAFDEGGSEDSLFDVLSGRKPLPPRTEPSYTEQLDLEVETEEEYLTTRMDDTFREMKSRKPVVVDPLDDSEIF